MIVNRSMKTRVYVNNKTNTMLIKSLGIARLTKNVCLQKWKNDYEVGISNNYYSINKWWNSIKKNQYPFVYEASKLIQENAIKDLATAFNHFTEGKGKLPTFSRKGTNDTFRINGFAMEIKDKKIYLPNDIVLNMRENLRWEPIKIYNVTISRVANRWFAAIQMLVEIEEKKI